MAAQERMRKRTGTALKSWRSINSTAPILITSTIEEALIMARHIGDRQHGTQTLLTGSLYFIGGVLSLLNPQPDCSLGTKLLD